MQTTNHQDFIFKKLLQISDCNQDFENRAALLSSILRDINALYALTQKGSAWRNLLEETFLSLKLEKVLVTRYQQNLLNFTKLEVKKLIAFPSGKLTASSIQCLLAVRGLIVLWSLNNDCKIASTLLDQLDGLFKAKSSESILLIEKINLTVESLTTLQAEYEAGSKWFKFISALIQSLQAADIGPALNRKSSTTEISVLKHNMVEEHSGVFNVPVAGLQTKEKPYKSILDSGDLLRYNLLGLNFLFRKEFSGVKNLFSNYHPAELLQFVPSVVKTYESNQDDVSFAFLLCLILRCHVSRFNLITLSPNSGSNIWLDLQQGFIVWNRHILISGVDEIDPVSIPLPLEIVNSLTKKLQQLPNSKALGDLFADQLPNLKKLVRKFTFTNSLSSHRPFVTRLHFSYGRFILHFCRDEVYAAAISIDFSLGVSANFNYVVLDPIRINKICEDVYKRLGFSGEFLNPVITVAGSKQGQEVDKIVSLLNESLQSAKTVFEGINNHSSTKQLASAHNQIVFSLALLLSITCGLRKARQYSVCNHTLDLKNGLMLINDKASTEYLTSRVIPIPDLALQWLFFYKNWLKSLAFRMSKSYKQLSIDIASVCDEKCGFGGIPLLFYFHRGELKPVGSKHIHLFVKTGGFESNLGRHFLDRILRNSLGSVLLNAHAGRANLGQESFGARSALSVTEAMQDLRIALDRELSKLNIVLPPKKQSVRYVKHNLANTFQPLAWKKPSKKKKQLDESCPYGESTLLNARNFERLIAYWVSTEVKKEIGQLAISLILIDGIFHEEEVIFSVKELIQGKIFKIENEYFVDIDTPILGIRRVNLSSITLNILNSVALPVVALTENEIQLQINDSLNQFLTAVEISPKSSLTTIAKMAEDFYSIRLPGALREWMCGRQHARTLRPEALFRHKVQLKEMLSDLGKAKRNVKGLRSNQLIINALNDACDKDNNKDSNTLRMKKLASVLEGVSGTFFSLSDNVLADYAYFLSTQCPKIKSPSSVRTHFYVIKQLVQSICLDLDDLEELNAVDWLEVSNNFLNEVTDERRVASLNYLLRLFKQPEIKSLKKDEARASRIYLDFPSSEEVELAIKLIYESTHFSEHQKLAALMLRLLAHLPLRAEDVAALRVSDVFIGESSFIIITSASTGSHKSNNANRVLLLTDQDLIDQLGKLQKLRTSMSKIKQPTTSLFGCSEVLTSFVGTEDLLSIISEALRCASGSHHIRPHSLRSKYLSENLKQSLMPQDRQMEALHQRNIIYELAVTAGHSDPDVSIKNYVCELNQIRRIWVDKLIVNKFKISAHFIASITSYSYEAVRKKLQRNFSMADLTENFQAVVIPQLKVRIFDLEQSHQMQDFQYPLNAEKESVLVEVQVAQFLACLHLGMEKVVAAAYVNIATLMLKDIETNFNIFAAQKGAEFFTKLRTDYKRFKLGEGFIKLAQSFDVCMIDPIQAAQLLRFLPSQMENPWPVSIKDIPLILEFISPRLQRAGFNLTVLIPDINLQETQDKISRLNRLGVRYVEKGLRRNFAARDQLNILFRKSGDTNQSHLAQKNTNFEINIFLLSFLIKHKIQG